MPWTVDTKYLAALRQKYLETHGQQTTLDDADISEMVNIHYSSGKLSHNEEAALTVDAMAARDRSLVARGAAE